MVFAVKSKNVLTPAGMREASILIDDGKIIDVLSHHNIHGCELTDYNELVLMPALTDTHVHINEPGRTEWEGFKTATMAAAAGGITTLVDMPLNSLPVTTNVKALNKKIDSAKDKIYVDVGFYGGFIPNNISDLAELIQNGVFGLKSFMIDSGLVEFPNVTEEDLRKGVSHLRNVPHRALPLLVHAEIDCGFEKTPAYDECCFNSFLETRPREWENKAIKILIDLCREFKYPIHIVHLSSSDAIEMIKSAKSEGLPLTVETCPHYLFFSSEEISDKDTRFKCTPPIRENENREKLWDAVKDGTIDFIVSDHSPCNPELKFMDKGSFEEAWGGISSLQFGLSVIWTEARKRGLTLNVVSKLMCENTAKFIGLEMKKGKIEKGYDADIIIFDPDKKFIVEENKIFHRHKETPYSGRELYGVVETTFLRGEKVFNNGKIISSPLGEVVLNKLETSIVKPSC